METQEPVYNEFSNIPAAKKTGRGKKAVRIMGIALLCLAAVFAAICTAAAVSQKIFAKTTVLGVDMSGLTRQEAQTRWEEQGSAACANSRIAILLNGESAGTTTLTDLAVTVSSQDAVQAAWDAGHSGNFVTNGIALISSWFQERPMVPQLTFSEAMLTERVEALAESLSNQPIDGSYRIDEKDGFYLIKPADGRQVDASVLLEKLRSDLQNRELTAISCRCEVLCAKELDLDKLSQTLKKPVNAGYQQKTKKITASRPGVVFDVTEAKTLLNAAEPGQEVPVPAKLEKAKVTEDVLKDVLFRDVIGSYTTYVGGSYERKTNVRLAAEAIDGGVFNSSEVFDYNTEVGERTRDRGFQAAPAYVGGKTVDQVGGGICQVSSTLYYAAMLANLEIVKRDAHQFAPSYITFGCDATVSWGGPDFSFRNSTDYPIKIVTRYDNDVLTVEIYGTKVDDTYVRIISETLSTTGYKTIYEKTDELPEGKEQMEQSPYTGYYVKTWRNVYSADGELISSTFEASSDYESRDAIIKVGTKKTQKTQKADNTAPKEQQSSGGVATEAETPSEISIE